MRDITLTGRRDHCKELNAEIACPRCGEKDPKNLLVFDLIEQFKCDTCGKLFMPHEGKDETLDR